MGPEVPLLFQVATSVHSQIFLHKPYCHTEKVENMLLDHEPLFTSFGVSPHDPLALALNDVVWCRSAGDIPVELEE